MKTTSIDTTKAGKRKKAVDDLKTKGKPKKTVADLAGHVALIEEILGLG